MKKMTYLKKFNEASGEECDFETFKEIMMELSDYFHCEFHDYTKENDYFYDCELTIPQINDEEVDEEGTYLTAKYLLEVIPPTDEPGNIELLYTPLGYSVDNQIENLEKLKNIIMANNNKIKKIFKLLQEEIVPRFQAFSNFEQCSVGFDGDVLRICFDMPDEG